MTELFAFQSKTEKIGQHHFGAYSFYIEEMLAAPYGYLDPIGYKHVFVYVRMKAMLVV